MLLFKLDPDSPVPAYLQIRDTIVARVDDSTLLPGDALPPSRGLAESLGVHRSTVIRAYDEIRALGYLESRPGSYTTVRRRAPLATEPGATLESERPTLIDWNRASGSPPIEPPPFDAPANLESTADSPIDFERLAADPALAPADELRRCMKHLMSQTGAEVLDYAHPAGWLPLRETIASRLRAHGVSVGVDEILITNGAQQGIDLALRLLVRPGDRVVVEAPTYGMLPPLLQLHGARPIEIPMIEDGMDLDRLENVLQRHRPRLVYTMPNFHNPTGITTRQPHRERLLALCEKWKIPILEDGFEEEMKYFGKAVLPIKSMDHRRLVLYVGTCSKVVFPGFRVGWIAADRTAIERLTSIQHVTSLAANTIAQATAARFFRRGEFESYLRRIHRVYRRRMQVLLDGLEEHLPSSIQWTQPQGGYTAWITLPDPVSDELTVVTQLNRAGVRVAPGCRFYATPPIHAHLRLSIACIDEEGIKEGCRRLGHVLGGL